MSKKSQTQPGIAATAPATKVKDWLLVIGASLAAMALIFVIFWVVQLLLNPVEIFVF